MGSKSVWVGIDPGISGAVGLIGPCGKFINVWDMPTETRGKKRNVSPQLLAQLLYDINDFWVIEQVTIEQVHSMPRQGVASSFNFGEGYGIARGVVAGMFIPTLLITPQKWKKINGLIGKEKDQSRAVAHSYWPDCNDLKRKKDSDRAEALLIALTGKKLRQDALGH